MTKELPKLWLYNLKDGRIYVGICDEMNWEDRNIILKEANLFLLESELIGKENYKEKVKRLYEKHDVRTNYLVAIDELNSAYVLP